MSGLKGGVAGSIAALRSAVKKGSGSGFIQNVPDAGLTVRFLTEPGEWFAYKEHYDQERKFFPCADDCPGCDEGLRASDRYLTNAYDVEAKKIIALKITKTLARKLMGKYDRHGTVMDRDYELEREGTGLETEYGVEENGVSRAPKGPHQLIDLQKILESQLVPSGSVADDDDEEEDEAPAKPKRTRKIEDEYTEMDRAELRAAIRAVDPDYRILKSHTYDQLRAAARALAPDDDEEEGDPGCAEGQRHSGRREDW
jgi:hypothetical protein